LLPIHWLQVVAAANDNVYGLAAGVLAKDQGTIDSLVRRIKAGTVWVNTYNVYDAGNKTIVCIIHDVASCQQLLTCGATAAPKSNTNVQWAV
jgi:hypothetical protein